MYQIRSGVFETNSSSTHSICICTDEELKAWKNNEIFWDGSVFVTKEEVLNDIRSHYPDDSEETLLEKISQNPWDYDAYTFDSWGEDYEQDFHTYTTKSGDKINILCYYGYDN